MKLNATTAVDERPASVPSWITSVPLSFLVVFALAVAFRLATFGHPDLRGNDELSYLGHARIFGEQGLAGFRQSIQRATENPETLTGPPPFRILYFCAAWASCKLLSGYETRNLAWLSWAAGIGTVLVGYALFRKWFSPQTAFLGALLLITSPVATALSRRALQDGFFEFIVVLGVWVYHHCWTRQRPSNAVWFGLCILAGLLTKESMVLLLPCFGAAACLYAKQAGWRPLRGIGLAAILACAVYLLIMIGVSGGLEVYVRTYRAYADVFQHSDYVAQYQRGPWFRYLIDFLLVAPLTGVAAIIGAAHPAPKEETFGQRLSSIYGLSILVLFTAVLTLNIRFVLVVDVFLRALAALAVSGLLARVNVDHRRRRYIVLGLVGLLLATDIRQFQQLFVHAGVYDPFTLNLLGGNGF